VGSYIDGNKMEKEKRRGKKRKTRASSIIN